MAASLYVAHRLPTRYLLIVWSTANQWLVDQAGAWQMVNPNQDNDADKTQTHAALTKGTMVGHYRIIEKIGAGGHG